MSTVENVTPAEEIQMIDESKIINIDILVNAISPVFIHSLFFRSLSMLKEHRPPLFLANSLVWKMKTT